MRGKIFLSGKNRPISLVGIRWQVGKAKLTQFISSFSGEDGGFSGVGGDGDGVLVGRVARRVARVVAVVDGGWRQVCKNRFSLETLGFPGKLIVSKRISLREILFSY